MKRDYANPQDSQAVTFFVGREVEKTVQHNQLTLFVVGTPRLEKIDQQLRSNPDVTHVYLGANKSFYPSPVWNQMCEHLLGLGYHVTLDYPVRLHSRVFNSLDESVINHDEFTAMISVEIPNIQDLNNNTTIKIDDQDFRATNPGVWCHPLTSLQIPPAFTDWAEYGDDEVLS